MSLEEIEALVRKFAEVPWSTGNLAVLDEVCSPDYIIHDMDGTTRDLETMKQGIVEARTQVQGLTSRVSDIIANGDFVAYKWKMQGKLDGRTSTMEGMTFLRLKDGKIVDDSYVSTEPAEEAEVA